MFDVFLGGVKIKQFNHVLLVFNLLLSNCLFAASDDVAELTGRSSAAPPSIGNFALPSSQQPGALISFGQTLVDKNQLQLYYSTFSPYHIVGPFRNMNASAAFGVSDVTALFFNYPVALDYGPTPLPGLAPKEITLQLEHAFYASGNVKYQEQATVVGAALVPLDDTGAMEYFLGATYNRTYTDWMMFVSPGILVTTSSQHVQPGGQYLYQAGIGHNILSVTDKSMLFALLELDGTYSDKSKFFGRKIFNSGGNVVALTPSLSFSTRHLIAQVGVGFPIVQHLTADQVPLDYFIAATFNLTIG